jgi:hypothetical protein
MTLREIRRLIELGKYSIRPHTIQHGLKEGFMMGHVIEAIMNGKEIERYLDRSRVLIYGRPLLTDHVRLDLHVVCNYSDPSEIDIVIAYIPDPEEWETPFRRIKRR